MKRISYLLAAPWFALTVTACSTVDDVFSEDTASDAIGLPRAEPGAIVIDEGETTVATPYGGQGEAATCPAVARDIARLTALLGPDEEPAAPEVDGHEDEDGLSLDEAGEFASDAVSRAPDMAEDVARDTIVGLNPARPVVRFLGRAGEIEAAARLERELALKRRAWLRGAFDVQACDPAVLDDALGAYNLLVEVEPPAAEAEQN
jgi:hypothetical protein